MAATLPAPNNCCDPQCSADEVTTIPGPKGDQGDPGTNGTNGINAFTTLTSGFTQPAIAGTVIVNVASSAWMALGQKIFVENGGYYNVAALPSATQVTLENLGYTGNAAPASSIANGSRVSPGGIKGTDGAAGSAATVPLTTKGDILTHDGAATARMAAGTNGQAVVFDSGEALGVAKRTITPNAATDNLIPRFDASGVITPTPLQASLVQITDDGAVQTVGGNARGSRAVDLQSGRALATQVASGLRATIGGGINNTASGPNSVISGGIGNSTTLDSAVVAGGESNLASAVHATVSGGTANQAQARGSAIGGGEQNNASGQYSTVAGGVNNTPTGDYSGTAWGQENGSAADYSSANGKSAVAALYGQLAVSSGAFSAVGDAQWSNLCARNITSDGTLTELFLDGSTSRIVLPDDTTWAFEILVVARRTDADNESAAYKFMGCIDRNSGVGTTSLVGSVDKTVIAEDTAAWDCNVVADISNGALRIEVTGEAAKTIRWVARIQLSQVTG